ncbi:hypothetical protein [Subtercola endophyticus]|uniref:hypothetical protein n=1 Tax=Subtercola endophyticus TaxID=2895559 RepID=UPI001E4E2465|nr:hypothetical protein [Subtercola endophyticus]UFS60869.1 hypothetical protein LQ955_09095 [Subtercola endophyticus]
MLAHPDAVAAPPRAAAAPRLSRRERGSAQLAGGIGFALVAIGMNLATLIFAFMGAGLLAAAFADDYLDGSGHITQTAFSAIVDAYGAPVGATAAGAVLLVAAGLVTSMLILRAGGHVRRRAITGAGTGISCIPNIVAALIAYFGGWVIAGSFHRALRWDSNTTSRP